MENKNRPLPHSPPKTVKLISQGGYEAELLQTQDGCFQVRTQHLDEVYFSSKFQDLNTALEVFIQQSTLINSRGVLNA